MHKFTILFLLVFTGPISAKPMPDQECRNLIVTGYKLLKQDVKTDDFSTNKFEDFDLTVEQFNQLSAEEQIIIYNKIKPLGLVVSEVIDALNDEINRYVGTFYEFFMAADIQKWRLQKDLLRDNCNPIQK